MKPIWYQLLKTDKGVLDSKTWLKSIRNVYETRIESAFDTISQLKKMNVNQFQHILN